MKNHDSLRSFPDPYCTGSYTVPEDLDEGVHTFVWVGNGLTDDLYADLVAKGWKKNYSMWQGPSLSETFTWYSRTRLKYLNRRRCLGDERKRR